MLKSMADEGTVTAEFALAMPAIAFVAIFAFGLLSHANEVAVLQSDLAQYARALARNEPEFRVRGWFTDRHPKIRVDEKRQGGAFCLRVELHSLIPPSEVQHCVWIGDF
jgi:hypothetical protein